MSDAKTACAYLSDILHAFLCALFLILTPITGFATETGQHEAKTRSQETSNPAHDDSSLEHSQKDIMEEHLPVTDSQPEPQTDSTSGTEANPVQELPDSAPDMEKSAADQIVYPGVENRSIVRRSVDAPSLEIYYPVFGYAKVDAEMKAFAEKQADEYEKDVAEAIVPGEERPASYEQWEMTGYFTLERPNPDVVSVIFNIFSYSGGAHGNLAITCLNYNLKTGQRIDFADLFRDPERALEMMSKFSAEKLNTELGEYADEDMIHSGTMPDLANFSNLTLFPNGIYIEFQPYQVGPWAAGPQRVEMTLQDLAAAGPEPDIWPQAANIKPAQDVTPDADSPADPVTSAD